jgi:crossover junction endodeoxyribonuclease RusA
MSFSIELPIRIESEANGREHWAPKMNRVKMHRQAAIAIPKHKLPGLPCMVTLTRIAPRRLDGDNLQSGFKALRDGIADRMGVKDNDPGVTWVYAQERAAPKVYACRISITKGESDAT